MFVWKEGFRLTHPSLQDTVSSQIHTDVIKTNEKGTFKFLFFFKKVTFKKQAIYRPVEGWFSVSREQLKETTRLRFRVL